MVRLDKLRLSSGFDSYNANNSNFKVASQTRTNPCSRVTGPYVSFTSTGPSHSPTWRRSPRRGWPSCPTSSLAAGPATRVQRSWDAEGRLKGKQGILRYIACQWTQNAVNINIKTRLYMNKMLHKEPTLQH